MNCDEKGDCELGFVRADNRRPTRNGAGRDKLLMKRANHEYRKNYFSLRVIEDWNELPDTVKEARNVSAFKCLYRRHRDARVISLETQCSQAVTENASQSSTILTRLQHGATRIISKERRRNSSSFPLLPGLGPVF